LQLQIKKATKTQSRLRLALVGISGSGKTYSSLQIAAGLGQRVLLLDTEHGSASKYADEFQFDVLELESFDPRTYIEAIELGEGEGYDVLIVDSLSHAWSGKGGALELVDQAARRNSSGNSFAAWRDVTPLHNRLIDKIVGCRSHLIATMRAKTEYVQEKDERGKTIIRKVGLAPVQRDQMEYEFDVVGDIDDAHNLRITKSRCRFLSDQFVHLPTENQKIIRILSDWLGQGKAGGQNGHQLTDEPLEALPDVSSATTDDLRARLALLKAQQPDHPQKREIAQELRRRKQQANSRQPEKLELAQKLRPYKIPRRAFPMWSCRRRPSTRCSLKPAARRG